MQQQDVLAALAAAAKQQQRQQPKPPPGQLRKPDPAPETAQLGSKQECDDDDIDEELRLAKQQAGRSLCRSFAFRSKKALAPDVLEGAVQPGQQQQQPAQQQAVT